MTASIKKWIGLGLMALLGCAPQHDYHIYDIRLEPNMLDQVDADGFNVSDDGKSYVFWDGNKSNIVAQFAVTPTIRVIRVH